MIRKSLGVLLAAALLTAGAPPAPSPAVGAFGFDANGMDRSVRPGDDFYRFAVGRWVDRTEIPADRSSIGSVSEIKRKVDERVRRIIEQAADGTAPAGSEERKIGDYFASFMDEGRIEQLGATPLGPELAAIAAIGTRAQLSAALGASIRTDVDPLNLGNFYTPRLMGLFVGEDLNDATRYRAYLMQGGLGMPEREYYLGAEPKYAELRLKYAAHVARMLRLAGVDRPDERARRVVALETAIAGTHASVAESADPARGNSVWLRSTLAARAPGLDWTAFLRAAGLDGETRLGAWQPAAITGISALVGSRPLDEWKDYLAFHTIESAAPYLSKAFADEHFAFNRQALLGTPQPPARWKRGVDETSNALGEAVGKLYVAHYFPPDAKAKAQQMAGYMLKAFAARLDGADWMGPRTRAEARRKLATFRVMLGYPDRWRDYSALRVERGDAYGNWRRSSLFDYRRNLAKLGRPVDRSEWFMTPQTVNGLFSYSQNSITLPAAILSPTFFDPDADAAVNYGAFGAGLGHEITHGFDEAGAQFDHKGNLRNWWTRADLEEFHRRADRLARQFAAYEPLPGLHIDGEQTSVENIADLGGLSTSWEAYRLSLQGRPGPVVDGFTPEQRFFLGWAQNNRAKFREGALRRQLLGDILPPTPYRALTVRNLDGWYRAFDVTPGQKLYLAPADRVRIW